MNYIDTIANTLKDDINNRGWCYNLIKNRIYGSMQISKETLVFAQKWVDYFETLDASDDSNDSNSNDLKNYAKSIKTIFKESFSQANCNKSSCILDKFCEDLVNLTEGDDFTRQLLKSRCLNDSWRFQGLIKDGSVEYCEYDIVPMNGLDVSSCSSD